MEHVQVFVFIFYKNLRSVKGREFIPKGKKHSCKAMMFFHTNLLNQKIVYVNNKDLDSYNI